MNLDNYLRNTLKIVFAQRDKDIRLYKLRNRTIIFILLIILTITNINFFSKDTDTLEIDKDYTYRKEIIVKPKIEEDHKEIKVIGLEPITVEATKINTKQYIVIISSSVNKDLFKKDENNSLICDKNGNLEKINYDNVD